MLFSPARAGPAETKEAPVAAAISAADVMTRRGARPLRRPALVDMLLPIFDGMAHGTDEDMKRASAGVPPECWSMSDTCGRSPNSHAVKNYAERF